MGGILAFILCYVSIDMGSAKSPNNASFPVEESQHIPCGYGLEPGMPQLLACGPDPMLDTTSTNGALMDELVREGSTGECKCIENSKEGYCFCKDAVYSVKGGKVVNKDKALMESFGSRSLQTTWVRSGMLRLDNDATSSEKFVFEVRLISESLWSGPPNVVQLNNFSGSLAQGPHPTLIKGTQAGLSLGNGAYVDFRVDIPTIATLSVVSSIFHVFKAYETTGDQETPTGFLFMSPRGKTMTLSSVRAYCSTPVTSIGSSLPVGPLATMGISATTAPCATVKVSCSALINMAYASGGRQFQYCSMDLSNFGPPLSRTHWLFVLYNFS
jgi:hypothetical protein